MAWTTEEILRILKSNYPSYVATTKNEVKKNLRAKIIQELRQLEKDERGTNNVPVSLPDDDDILDKVCFCCYIFRLTVLIGSFIENCQLVQERAAVTTEQQQKSCSRFQENRW
jgi:hypothetical protein